VKSTKVVLYRYEFESNGCVFVDSLFPVLMIVNSERSANHVNFNKNVLCWNTDVILLPIHEAFESGDILFGKHCQLAAKSFVTILPFTTEGIRCCPIIDSRTLAEVDRSLCFFSDFALVVFVGREGINLSSS
jgi:hypothetical protein